MYTNSLKSIKADQERAEAEASMKRSYLVSDAEGMGVR